MPQTSLLVVPEKELYQSCQVLFGSELDISREFLQYVQLAGVKSAYRQRARETHPDLAGLENEPAIRERHQLFQDVQEAYQKLLDFLNARESGRYFLPPPGRMASAPPHHYKPRPHSYQKAAPRANSGFRQQTAGGFSQHGQQERQVFWDTDGLYRGPIPNRQLLFGHFLYYSGLINWKTIIQALIWQRNERPRIGELGKRFGMLTEAEILHILRHRPSLAPFGEVAVQLGLLSKQQLQLLVAHQKRLQKKFGEFLLSKQHLTHFELQELLRRYQQHNAQVAYGRNSRL